MDDDDDDLVFELGDDDFHAEDLPRRGPAPPFRERLHALKPTRATLPSRSTARLTALVLLVVSIGAGTSAAATAWTDAAARRARDADVVKLTLNALTDGDLTTSSADTGAGTATEDYLLEFANNGPVPVTVQQVTLKTQNDVAAAHSTGWIPLTAATVPPGGIARIAVHMALTCSVTDVQADLPPSYAMSFGSTSAPAGLPAEPDVTVTTPNGQRHSVILRPPQGSPQSSSVVTSFGAEPVPQTIELGNAACAPFDPHYADIAVPRLPPAAKPANSVPPLSLRYDGIATAATTSTPDTLLRFTLTDTSKSVAVDLTTMQPDPGITLTPGTVHLKPGGSQQITLKLANICDQEYQYMMLSGLRLTVAAGPDITQPSAQSLTGGPMLVLARDLTNEQKAACP